MNSWLLSLALIATVVGSVYGLDCYECSFWKGVNPSNSTFWGSTNDKNCEKKPKSTRTCGSRTVTKILKDGELIDLLEENTAKQIGNGTYFCYKYQVEEGKRKAVRRTCAIAYGNNTKEGCSEQKYTEGSTTLKSKECICSKNKCNSAGFFGPSSILIVGAFVAISSALLQYIQSI